jgi:methylated-DNA-[protein]-cysteine S-methyltransferase
VLPLRRVFRPRRQTLLSDIGGPLPLSGPGGERLFTDPRRQLALRSRAAPRPRDLTRDVARAFYVYDVERTVVDSPIGTLGLVASGQGLRAVVFEADGMHAGGRSPILAKAAAQLEAYFDGDLETFDLPLELYGTEFQRRCWLALASIPYGQTVSYGEQSRRLGLGIDAARAVGAANGQNPLPIVLPCHRVIGADGSLTGFGAGLDVKRFLLEHEGALLPLG